VLATAPPAIVQWLRAEEAALTTAISAWNGDGPAPKQVMVVAIDRERLIRRIALSKKKSDAVMAIAPNETDDIEAERDLLKLHQSTPPQKGALELRPAPEASKLLSWYQEAQARFGIRWTVLAAINFVESAFCRVKNESGTGAQGPMQFMPATWKAYGMGGNVRDAHDSILGAANYLAANGGVTDTRTALRAYNPSSLYVDAVLHYAHRMAHVPAAFYEYYAR
jgi:membrane-bound lytic murein transglycosylase B